MSRERVKHAALYLVCLIGYVAVALFVLRFFALPAGVKLGLFWAGFISICWWFGTRAERLSESAGGPA